MNFVSEKIPIEIFSSPDHILLRFCCCDHSQASVVCPSVHIFCVFCVYTLVSTNINHSAPNLVKMYVTITSLMSLIVDLIGIELSELTDPELEKLSYLTLFTLWHMQI